MRIVEQWSGADMAEESLLAAPEDELNLLCPFTENTESKGILGRTDRQKKVKKCEKCHGIIRKKKA